MLQEGTWPDGFSPEERENLARLDPKGLSQPTDACQDGAVDDKWQARNLTTSLSKALRKSCRLGYSDHNSLYAKLWQDTNPMLVPAISHLFWDHFTRSSRKLKACTVRNALKLRHGTFWNARMARPYLGKASDGKCPLCRNPDSGTHVLGACTHRLVKGLILRDTRRLLQLLERPSWKEPKVDAWQC